MRAIKNKVTVHGKHPFLNAIQKRALPFRPAKRKRQFALTGTRSSTESAWMEEGEKANILHLQAGY